MTIKYLIFSGGGAAGLIMYGSYKYLSEIDYINIKNIKEIYANSIGCILAAVITMGHDWITLDDYLIKRPWEKLLKLDHTDIYNIGNEKGILGDNFIEEILEPLLLAKGLTKNVTLLEYFEFTKVCLNFYTLDINNISNINPTEINYKTFPNITLIKAIRMSAAIPILFKPVCYNNSCFIDAGFTLNFPLDTCLKNTDCNPKEVMAFRNDMREYASANYISEDSTMSQYLLQLLKYLINVMDSSYRQQNIKNIIINDSNLNQINLWYASLSSKTLRAKMIQDGISLAIQFIEDSRLETS